MASLFSQIDDRFINADKERSNVACNNERRWPSMRIKPNCYKSPHQISTQPNIAISITAWYRKSIMKSLRLFLSLIILLHTLPYPSTALNGCYWDQNQVSCYGGSNNDLEQYPYCCSSNSVNDAAAAGGGCICDTPGSSQNCVAGVNMNSLKVSSCSPNKICNNYGSGYYPYLSCLLNNHCRGAFAPDSSCWKVISFPFPAISLS